MNSNSNNGIFFIIVVLACLCVFFGGTSKTLACIIEAGQGLFQYNLTLNKKYSDKNIRSISREKIYLRKNNVGGVNTLTQEMMSQANAVYVVRYKYVLGEDIVIPENCLLIFEGGCLCSRSLKGKNTRVENKKGVIFKDLVLKGAFSGEAYSSWFKGDDDDVFSNIVLFDSAFIESNLILDRVRTPVSHKSTYIQGVNNPIIYTDFDDESIAGNGVNAFRITTPMGVEEVALTMRDLSIIDVRYNPDAPLVKSMSSGFFVFPHDPNTNMIVNLQNLKVKTRGDSFGFSHERDDGYTYDGTFYLYVDNCSIESGEFCIETYKPGDVREMHFTNSRFVSTHSFRPELSLGTHAVAGQKREAHIYVRNCTFDKGIENGIHEYASNPSTKYVVTIDSCVFNKYLYISELNVHRAGEGVEVTANHCYFRNDDCFQGSASGGEKLEFNDCVFDLRYKGDAYGIFAAKTNIFRHCSFNCNRMQRFYGNYRNGTPLLYKEISFDNCTFNNTDVVVARYEESIAAGMKYKVSNCNFIGSSTIRHWNTTDYEKSEKCFNSAIDH